MNQTLITINALVFAASITALIITIIINARANSKVRKAEEELKKARTWTPKGLPFDYATCIDEDKNILTVYGHYRSAENGYIALVPIKEFRDDDLEFAILEAQELIEHLNED